MTYFQATFEDKLEFNSTFDKYSFELKNPYRLPFKSGQFVKIKINDQATAEYFILSSPAIDHGFEILLDKSVVGPSVEFFGKLKFGDIIEFEGPLGDFVLDQSSQKELVLIGSMVGISPLYSMVQDLLQVQQSKRKITLYWELENLDQLCMTDDLEDLVESFPNFNFHPVIGKALPEWNLCRGSVYDCLNVHEVNADAEFYVCANQELAEKIKQLCLTNGVSENQLNLATYAKNL